MKALKWIGGCLGIGLVLVLGVCWFGYKQMKNFAGEGTPTIVIHAPATRVFANIANADSLTEWRTEGLGIRSTRKGLLRTGDTVMMQMQGRFATQNARATWIVSAVKPNQLVAMDMLSSRGVVVATRRDSLVPYGDSTLLVSDFNPTGLSRDSVSDTSGLAINMMRLASRAQMRMEQQILRALLQGDSLPPRPGRAP